MAGNTASYDQHNAIGRNIAQDRARQFNASIINIHNGNPGTGKSTLMKFLFEDSEDKAKLNLLRLWWERVFPKV